MLHLRHCRTSKSEWTKTAVLFEHFVSSQCTCTFCFMYHLFSVLCNVTWHDRQAQRFFRFICQDKNFRLPKSFSGNHCHNSLQGDLNHIIDSKTTYYFSSLIDINFWIALLLFSKRFFKIPFWELMSLRLAQKSTLRRLSNGVTRL